MGYGRSGRYIKPPPGVQLDFSHRLAQGLVGCWLMNEGAGSRAIDLTPFKNHGVLTNGPVWTGGRRGQALSFDGVNDYVNLPTSASLNLRSSSFTISAWIKTDVTNAAMRIINKFNAVSVGGWLFDVHSDTTGANNAGDLRTRINDGTNNFAFNVEGNIAASTWYHVAMTVDRSAQELKLWVNGAQIGTTQNISAVTGSLSTTVDAGIGTIPAQSVNFFDGLIDEVRVYNRALSAGEVAELARAEYAEFLGPVAWRDFVPGGLPYQPWMQRAPILAQ